MSKLIEIVEGHGLQLRPLVDEDLPFTLAWRNRDDARVWFKHSAVLTPVQHRAWFQSYAGRENDLVWIAWDDGRRVGQVAVYDIDWAARSAEVGRFLAAPDAIGRGHMYRACRLLIEHCREQLKLQHLYLEVLAHNERAQRLYKGLGFLARQEDEEVVFMGLTL